MKIKYKDYLIEGQANDIVVSQVCTYGKDSKLTGQTYTRPIAYFGTVESLAMRLIDLPAFRAEASTLQELLTEVKKVHAEIKEICKEAVAEKATV